MAETLSVTEMLPNKFEPKRKFRWVLMIEGIDAFIVNFGAYSHTSIALRDALAASDRPAIEVHISDIKKREKFRRTSMTAGACRALICGQGFPGYIQALHLLKQL